MAMMGPADLAALAKAAQEEGWATARASSYGVLFAARQLGWEPVENRRGDGGVTALVPKSPEQAHAASHSAKTGLGEQPLHTDGAHQRRPPRWLLLHAAAPNATPTKLCRFGWNPIASDGTELTPGTSVGGLFLVDSGKERFLAPAHTREGGWRWDPGCMTACDQRARETEAFLLSFPHEPFMHEWSEVDQWLLIDNTKTLHARCDASEDPDRRLTRLTFGVRPA
jgi:hypothetical protein